MPNTLPVPSNAALRTLRNIALGTSCTVAFTTGLLTEDRRRRIHAAREVHNNAKKLKSSRKYHRGGTFSADSFEDQVIRYDDDDGFWQAKDCLTNVQFGQVGLPVEPMLPEYANSCPQPPALKISKRPLLTFPKVSSNQPFDSDKNVRLLESAPALQSSLALPSSSALPQGLKLRKVFNKPKEAANAWNLYRQRKLASDVMVLLKDKHGPSNTDAAALYFLDCFEGLPFEGYGFVKELTDAASQLSKACQTEGNFDASNKIVDIVVNHGPIEEDIFQSLGVERIVRNLIGGLREGSAGDTKTEASKLRKAVALYLTKFKEKPRIASDSWRALGQNLCATTYRFELFDLTEAVYWRLEQTRGDAPNCCVHHLLAALHKLERHRHVLKIFRRLFTNETPDQLKFYTTGGIVVESALRLRRIDIAEETLVSLAKMSEGRDVQCSTSWFLKVLGTDWRTHREISRTQALFERLAPYIHLARHSQALYAAMIQFCVEAGDETAARSYYKHRIAKASPGPPSKNDIRVQGHFAYAKAMRNDWTGVQEDFQAMRQLSPEKHELSPSFVPIFKLFAKSHSVDETEEFLRFFIDHHLVALTPYLSTTMISKYAETGEIESILRWLDYMTSVQCPADPMFFNTIIYNCRTKWKFSFEETYRLYQEVQKMGGPAAKFINNDTISILRRAAIAGSGKKVGHAVKNLNRLKLEQQLKLPVDNDTVQEHMAIALAKGNPCRALRIYERAQHNILPLDARCISLAVKAILQIDPKDINAAASLLREPQRAGQDISPAAATIFIHQLSYQCRQVSRRLSQVAEMARTIISVLEDRGVTVPPQMITHTTHTLVRHGQYYQAIDFWKSMVDIQRTPTLLDLPTLTVLLQAYIGARDCVGIEWVVRTISVNSLVPDDVFKRVLKVTLSEMRKAPEGSERGYFDQKFYSVVQNALESISAMRLEATKDKEIVRATTMMIMEKAIEIDRLSNLNVKSGEVSKLSLRNQMADEKNSITPGSEGFSGWRSSGDPAHCVSVQAG